MVAATLYSRLVQKLPKSLRRPELPLLVALLVFTTATWAFIKLASEVTEGDTQHFDNWVLETLRNPDNPRLPRGPLWLLEAVRDVTALGGVTVLTLMTVLVAGYFALRGERRAMLVMLLAVISGVIVSTALKAWFDRQRPPHGSDLAATFSSSFPSGHSMLSAVVYLTLGMMLARRERRWAIRIYFLAVAGLLTGLVGMSRVYLGVHYPTDVLGGWIAGSAWALLWWFIALRLDQPPDAEPAGEKP